MTKAAFYYMFHLICFMATAGLVLRCIYNYNKDDDTTQLEYRKFHDGDDTIYPSFSICFRTHSLFDENEIMQVFKSEPKRPIHKILFNLLYKRYFNKKCFTPPFYRMVDFFKTVDYKNVTKDLMRHFISLEIILKNNGELLWSNQNGTFHLYKATETIPRNASDFREAKAQSNFTKKRIASIPRPKMYPSYNSYHKKCYSFDVPFIKGEPIQTIGLRINGSLFQCGIRPSKNEFSLKFHYPNQQLMSISSQGNWKSKFNFSTNYIRYIDLGYIHILRRRNKRNRPCIDENYDRHVTDRIAKLIGCKKHIFNTTENIPSCRRWSQIVGYNLQRTKNTQIPPCRSLISVYDWFDELDMSKYNDGEPLLTLVINYPDDFYK